MCQSLLECCIVSLFELMELDEMKEKADCQPSHAHITPEQIVKTYINCRCNKTATAEALGMSRQNLYFKIDGNEELKKMIASAQESLIDKAEDKLQELVEKGDFQAVKFYLERIGRKRGYGNTLEITGDKNKPLHLIKSEMSVEEAAQVYADTLKEDEDDL